MDQPTDYADMQKRWCHTRAESSLAGARERARRVKRWLDLHSRGLGDVLCIGPRWGDEMEEFLSLGASDVMGIEVVPEFAVECKQKGLLIMPRPVEKLELGDRTWNVYCSHVLEHSYDRDLAIRKLQAVCTQWFYIDSPIEPGEVKDKAHYSPFRSVGELFDYFGDEWDRLCSRVTGPNQRGNSNASVMFVRK